MKLFFYMSNTKNIVRILNSNPNSTKQDLFLHYDFKWLKRLVIAMNGMI